MTRRLLTSLSLGFTLAGLGGSAVAGTPPALLHPTLVLGVAVPVPAGFKAGDTGAEWALPGGARVKAEADAELRVLGAPQHLDLGHHRKVASYTVVLTSGMVRLSVPDDGSTAVLVSAPHKTSVIVASGRASVSAGQQVAVANADGSTVVAFEGSRFHALAPGHVEIPGLPKRPLLGAPALARSPSVLLSYGEPAELQALHWDAVPGAHAYRVEVWDEANARLVAATNTQATELPAGFARLEPGAYSVRLAAVDATGFESAQPVTRPLSVLGMTLPEGVFVDPSGTVRYAPGSANIAFEHADAVQMSYGHADVFAPAPAALGLFRAQPFVVRFRAGDGVPQELWLAPRTTHATIAFGPRMPSWPGKALEIDVRVDGASAPSEVFDAVPSVTVGIEPVTVNFTRDGARLHGVLPPRPGKGPWVVRVEVKDKRGMSLGRDFVEIAASEEPHRGGS